jgi:hypothetical protein
MNKKSCVTGKILQPVYWNKLFAFYNPDIFVIPVVAGIVEKIQKHQEEDEQEKQCVFLISRHIGRSIKQIFIGVFYRIRGIKIYVFFCV